MALAEYCEQLRFRKLHHARFTAERSARLSAEGAAEVKSQFISMMSHELRTPLNAIIGFSDILVDPNRSIGPAERLDYAEHINISGRHLIAMVNRVLEMSRIQSGAVEVTLEPHKLADILCESVEKLNIIAREKGVIVATRFDHPTAVALVDPVALRQCLDDITGNAVKFTEPGGIVTVGCKPVGDDVAISIADTGIGMDPDQLAHALTPFGQVKNGLDRGIDGTGLGLCITKELTELQHGRFAITSETGAGTEVTLTFRGSNPTATAHHGGGLADAPVNDHASTTVS